MATVKESRKMSSSQSFTAKLGEYLKSLARYAICVDTPPADAYANRIRPDPAVASLDSQAVDVKSQSSASKIPSVQPKRRSSLSTLPSLLGSISGQPARRSTISTSNELKGLVPTMRTTLGLKAGAGGRCLVREANAESLTVRSTMPPKYMGRRLSSSRSSSEHPCSALAIAASVSTVDAADQLPEDSDSSASFASSDSEDESESQKMEQDAKANEEDAKSFEASFEVSDRQLGEGSYGTVYQCLNRQTGETYAVKVVNKRRLEPNAVAMLFGGQGYEGEIHVQKSLPKHPNLVSLHSFYEEEQLVRLVMDHCSGGDLFDEIMLTYETRGTGLSEAAAAVVFGQLISAVAFLHSQDVVHRDIKVENVLLAHPCTERPLEGNDNVAKLCDFGFAARHPEKDGMTLTDRCGSPDYIAPEILLGEGYGRQVDIWSSGVVLFASLSACLPFEGDSDEGTLENVLEGGFTFDSDWDSVSACAKRTVKAVLIYEPQFRPSAAGILEWPFVAEHLPGAA